MQRSERTRNDRQAASEISEANFRNVDVVDQNSARSRFSKSEKGQGKCAFARSGPPKDTNLSSTSLIFLLLEVQVI
jgi:hypothetical protein